jgi:iron complex outermembrane receptor protein
MTNSIAQNITGTVKSTSGKPIPYINILVLNSAKGTMTDNEGNFSINLSAGTYQLKFSGIGFSTKINKIEVNSDNVVLNIRLLESTESLDEILVSSDKIETKLQETPAAVSSLSAQKLEKYRAWSITDLSALSPSLFVIEHGNSSGSNFFNIRGTMGYTAEQSVGTYVDGVYQFDFYSAPINFNNIERIEVLRGPQGTLYGRNAYSGVVNIITKKPTNTTNGYIEVNLGNYEQQRYSIGANLPIVKDKLFFNIASQYSKRGSIYSNTTLDTDSFDSRKSFNINGNLKYVINDNWVINLNAKTENNEDIGAYPWVSSAEIALEQPYEAFGNWKNTEKRTNTNIAASVNYFGEHFNFSSITAFIDYRGWYPDRFDYDFTAAKLISGDNDINQNQITQEFRFSSPASNKNWKWTAGSYLFKEDIDQIGNTFYEEDYVLFDANAPYTVVTEGQRKSLGVALFGQAAYSITSSLDFTAGARYDIEHKERTERNDLEKDDVITTITELETNTKTFNAFTPKFILSHKLNPNSLIYASYAKGFRVGGFNVGATNTENRVYDPEKSDNYEIAIKNNLFQNKLKLNITAFYLQQKDQQITTSTDGINYLTLNVGDMNNLGLETEIDVIPFKYLTLEWNASWSHAEYAKLELYDDTSGTVANYKGNRPIYNPNFSSMTAAQFSFPIKKSKQNMVAFVRAEYRYTGRYYFDFENTEYQSGYGLVNSRAGITAKNYEIALWGRNIMDTRYLSWGSYGSYLLGSPAMWGVSLKGKF